MKESISQRLVYKVLLPLIGFIFFFTAKTEAFSQCDTTVPTFTINLAGAPDSVWTSPSTSRKDNCCGTSNPDRCIRFYITLDADAQGIRFELVSGAIPSGALFYQIGCGTAYAVGADICLNGAGPHMLTFCKPGNNANEYQITSIPKPAISPNIVVSMACVGQISVEGLVEDSITWESVPFNATYNSYLNCSSGCDSVIVTPTGSFPDSVRYRACGPILGGCAGSSFCDTVTVYFVTNLSVQIQPDNPTLCFGDTATTITAHGSGGLKPYRFTWSHIGGTGVGDSVQYVDTGTYIVSLLDSLGCSTAKDTVIVTGYSDSIQARAGNDTFVCRSSGVIQLHGSVIEATGGIWSGSGTFSPSTTTLNATYTLSAANLLAGSAQLRLITTGNGTCPADTDYVTVLVKENPPATLSGPDTVCWHDISQYTADPTPGDTINWTVSGGRITGGNAYNTIDVIWDSTGTRSVSFHRTSAYNCDTTITLTVLVLATPVPVITGPDSACEFEQVAYSLPFQAGVTWSWVATGGTITSGQGTNAVNVSWNNYGIGIITVTETNANGCDSMVSDSIVIIQKPRPSIIGTDSACYNKIETYTVTALAGSSYSWSVSNGTLVTGQGTNSVTILWGSAGLGIVSLTQTSAFGCDSTVTDSIVITYTPTPVISGTDTACHNKIETYTTPAVGGDTYSWSVSNGAILSGQGTNTLSVLWGSVGTGIVSLTQTAAGSGCDSTVSDSIVILYTPAPVLSGPDSACHNKIETYTVTNVGGDSYSWSVSNGTIISGQGTNSIDILWGTAGTGVVILTEASPDGCDSTVSDSIVILYTPAPVLSGTDTACHNKIETYTVTNIGSDSYSWAVSNGTITSGQGTNSVTVLWGTIGTGVISITQTSPLGCDSTVSDSIVILYTPAPVLSGTDSACHNKIETYAVAGVATDTYSWAVSNGTILSGQSTNSVDVLWGTVGTGVITLTQTSPMGCDSTVSDSIVILYTPAPVLSGNDTACHNKIETYTVTNIGGDVYNWSVSNGTIIAGQSTNSVDILWGTVGTGVVSVTQTSALGCDSTVSDSIVIVYTPAPVLSGTDTACYNKIETYTVTSIGGDAYNWLASNGTIISGQGTNSIDVLWGTAGTGTITLTQTSPLGCDSTVSASIVILYTPAPVVSGPDTVCHNKIETHSVPNVAGDSYTWSASNGTIISGQGTNSIDVLWGTIGTGILRVRQTSPLGCDSTVYDTVIIHRTPAPFISGKDTVCHNRVYTYTTPVFDTDYFSWNVVNGTIVTGQGNDTIRILWGAVGAASISLTQTSSEGCDSTIVLPVTVIYTPAPVLSGTDTACHNKIETYSVTNVGGDSYSWNVSNGTIVTGQGTNSVDILWGAAGAGTVSVTETSPAGCDSAVSAGIVIVYTPAPVVTGPDTACHNKIETYAVTNIGGDSYNWTVNNGTIVAGQGTNTVDIIWGTAGTGVISVNQTSPLGCDSTVSDSIVILYTPAPILTGNDTACHNKIETYSVANVSGDSYSWNVTNGTIIAGQGTNSVDILWGTAGTGTVSVTQTSPLGCDSTVSASVVIVYTPAPVLTGPDTVCHNKIETYSVASIGGDSYSWNVTNGTIVTGQGTNNITILWGTAGTGIVSVTQTSPLGCDSTVSDSIVILYTPAPVLAGPDTVCHNKIETYAVTTIGGDSYNWNITNGTIVTGQGTNSVDIIWGTAGTGIVSVTQTSLLGCDSTVSDSIVILYTPAPVLAGPDTVCHNKIETYAVASIGGDSYSWNVSNGTIVSGQGTNTIDVLWGAAGTGTVSVTQTSPLGCDSTVSDSIVILYTPAPVLSGTDTACHNKIETYSVANVGGDSYSWNVSNGTITAGQGTNSADILWGTAGTGTVSVTQTSPLGCDSTVSATITILYTPAPVITGPDSACHNKIYTYSVPNVADDSYSWTVVNGIIITGQNTQSITVAFDSTGLGMVSITQTSPLGCDSVITDTVTVLYTPAPILTGADTTCHNKIYTYSTPAVAGDSYSWNVTNGIIVAGQGTNAIDVLWGTAGTGSVSLTQSSPLGCDSTLTATITILYTPAPIITGTDSACHNKIYTYSVPNVAGDSYSWTVTNGTIVSGQNTESITVAFDTMGLGTVSVTQTSPLACDSTVTNTINVLYTPAPLLAGTDTACHNNIYTYAVANVGGDAYSWNVTNGTIITGQGTNSVDIFWGTAGTGTVSVTQTSPLGCDSTLSANIVILYTPAPVLSGTDTACHNNIYTYSTPAVAGDSYSWNVTNGTIVAGQGTNSADILWGTAGTGTVSVTQTSPLGCDSTVLANITILYTPAPILSGPDTVCHNKIETYSVASIGGDTYSWNITNGTITAGQGTNSVDVIWGTAGTGVVSVTQTSPLGCDSTVSDSIVILYTPAPVLVGPDTVCHNKIETYAVTNVGGDSYSWNVTNGTIVAGQGTNSVDIIWGTAGAASITVTQTSPLGCDSTVTLPIQILYTPAPVITGPDSACHNKIYTYSVPNVAGDSYSWSVTNGTIITGQNTRTITVAFDTVGRGIVSITQTSPLGCDSTITDSITVLYTPAPVLTGADTTCHNNIYTYAIPAVAGDSYNWNVTNGSIIAGQGTNSVDILWGTAGTGTVSVTQTSPLGCDSILSATITILYTPAPVITGPDSACHNKIYTYSVSNVAGDSYSWIVTNGTIITGQNTRTITVAFDTTGQGTVSITQTSPLGCDSTVTDSITVIYTPAPVLSGTDTACHNKIYTYSTPAVAGDSYNWNVTNGSIVAGQGTNSVDILWGTAGTGTVSLTQTYPLSCDSTVSANIVILYTPAPVLSGTDTACHNNIYTYTVANVAGDSYNWNVTNGSIVAGQGTNSVDILWGTAGTGIVSVTQTSPLSCDSTVSANITILYTPAPVISGNDSACHNKIYAYSTPAIGGDSYNWSVTNGTIVTGQGTNNITILWGTAGMGIVSVTQTSALGCDSTVADSIVILYTPAPVLSGTDTACHNNIYTYSVTNIAGDVYNWSVANGIIVAGQGTNTVDILWGIAGTGTVSVTQTSPLGCDSLVSANVVILYTPAPVLSGPDSTCHNKIYSYSVPNVAGDSYSWAVTNGTIITGQNTRSITVVFDTVGLGTVTVTQTSPLGCDSTVSDSIVILYTPAPVLAGEDSACHNNIYTYATPNIAGDAYNWAVSNGSIISGQGTNTVNILWGTAGTGSVTVTQTSPLGCDSVITLPIRILYTPAPVITGPDSACHNKIYTYSVPNVAGDSYNWTVANGAIISGQSTNSITIAFDSVGLGTVSVTQTSPLGCDSTITDTIDVLYTPAPILTGADTTCHNKIYTYSIPVIAGDSYSWSVTNGTIVAGQSTNSVDILWGTAGTGTVSVTQTSPLGCDSTLSANIVILYTPAPVLSGTDTACHNNIYTYSVVNVAGDAYNWNITNGTIVAGQGTNLVDILWGTAGTGTVSVTQTSPLGCDSTLSATITILYTPAPVITGTDSACHNKIYSYSVPNVAGDSYSWAVTNGTIITGQNTTSITVAFDSVGLGTVSVIQTSPLGCDSVITDTINVLYTPAPILTGADTTCHNNIYTYSIPNIAGDSYNWNVTNGSIIAGQGTNTVDILWGTAGTGTVSVTQTSPLGCDSTLSATIIILYTPAPLITGPDSACHNKIYTYSVPNVAGDSYNWTVSNGTIISGQNTRSITVAFDSVGLGTVSIIQTSPLGCDSVITDTINVLYTPAPVLTGADTTCHNKIYTYSVPNIAGDSYSWNVTNGGIVSGQGTNSVDILWGTAGTGTVSVIQTSPLGCDSTLSATITILYTPAPVITGTDSACHNKIYTYSVPNVAGDSYNWTVTNGTIISGQNTNSISIAYDSVGLGTVSVTQTSPLACDSTVTDTINVLYTPAPVFAGADTACHNKIYTYSVPAIAGDSYSWNATNGAIVAGQGTNSVDILWGTAGTGTVSVTQTSPLGCDSTLSANIVILYTPAPVLSGTDTACHNNIYTYSVVNVAGDAYNWNITNGTIVAGQGTNTVDILWGTAGTGIISVTQTSLLGCDSAVTAGVTILYTPAPVISGPDTTCHNKIYSYSTPAIAGDSYNWSVTNGTIVTGQGTNSIDILWGTAGTGVVALTQTSPLGCDSTIADSIVILYTPAPVISGNDSACHNKIYSYSLLNIAGDTYNWSVSNGTIINGQGTNAVDVLWGNAGAASIAITQTSPLGCDSLVTLPVQILYTPAPVITGPDSACHNKIYTYSVPNVAGDSYSWTVSNGTIISGQNTRSITVVFDTVGLGTVTVTQTSPLACDSTITDTINVLYTPAPILNGADTTCHNNIYTYSIPNIAGDSYSWSVANGVIVAGQGTNSVDILWGTAGTGTVSVTQTSPLGCDSTLSATIIILYTPAPVITGPDSACHNKIYTYSVTNVAGDSYNWTVTNGTIISGQNTRSITVAFDSVGLGTVSVTQTSPLACDSTVIDTTNVLYTPAPVFAGADTACHNKIYTYSVPAIAGDSYSWNVSNGTVVAGQGTNSVDILWGTAGTGTVSVTQTSPLGCDSMLSATIIILYTPAPVISGVDSACHNKIYTYSVPNVAGDNYSWLVANGTIVSGQTTNSVDVLWGSAGAASIAVTQTSPLGCDSIITLPIQILYTPAPVIAGPDSACHNKIYTYSVPNVAGDSYSWIVTNGTIISGQNTGSITVAFDSVGLGTVSITQTSPLGCDSTITDTINVLYTPAPVLTGADTTCHNNIYTYSIPAIAGDAYNWSVANGSIIAGQGTNSVDILWGTAGTGTVSVTQTSPLGCDSTLSATITILYTPAPVITGPDSACHNKIYTYSVPNVAGDTYNWTVNNGTIISGQNTGSITVAFDTVGLGVISVTQTSPLGCDSVITDTINVLYTPAPILAGADTTCHNKIYTYSVPNIAGDSYSWSASNGAIVSGQGTNAVDILWGTAGTGTVSVTQTSPLGCDSTLSATITILYTPAPVITGPDSACHNKIYTYSVPNVAGDTYNWTVNNGTIISGQNTRSIAVAFDSIGLATVSITQTSPLGCDSVVTDTINVLYTPAPILAGADTACHNKIYTYSVPNIVGDSWSWSATNGAIVSGQGTNTVDILWGTAGTGTVSVTQTSPLGCDSTLSATITILYTPTPVITGADSACHNNIYTYSVPNVAGDIYNWSVANGTIISGQGTNTVDVLWGSAGAAGITVTQTSPLGCDSLITLPVQILYTPAPAIAGPDTVCYNKIYSYTTPAIGGDSYSWTVTNGTILAGQGTNNIDIIWGIAGNGTITLTQTSPLGCDSTVSVSIVILYTPAPVITGADTVCHNNIYTYSIPAVVGDTYTWAASNGVILSGQGTNTIDILWGTAGTGNVSVTQVSPLGCDSTIALPVIILYTPAPVLAGPDTVCHNKIYSYSTPAIGGDSYNWTVSNGTIITGQGTNSITVLWGTAGTGTVAVTQTSPLGCDSTISDSITIIYTPAPVISGPALACHHKVYTYSVPNVAGDAYNWSVSNGSIVAGQGTNSINVLWTTAGTGTVAVIQTSPLGCDSTVSNNIFILYTPAPVVGGADSACHNKIYTYTTPVIAGDGYNWTVSNGTILSGQGTNTIAVLWGVAGTGVVSLTQTSPLSCDSTVADSIVILYSPAPVIGGPDTVCHNKIYSYSTPAIAGDSYTWAITNGTIITGQGSNAISVLWGTAGSGTISVTQTSPLGCDSTVADNIIILYTPAPVISGTDSACHNKIYTYSTPNVAGDIYNWLATNGTIVSGQGTNSIDVLWGSAGTGSVAVTQTSPLGCDSTLTLPVQILYSPAPVIAGPDTTCHNKIYTYSTPNIGGDSYNWSVSNGTIITGQSTNSVTILWGAAGNGTVSVTQTSALGCDSSVTDTITILYSPAPVISGNDSVCHNNIYTYSTPAMGGDTYNWSVSNGTIIAGQGTNIIDILWGTAGTGSVTIAQTSPLGCDSIITLPVRILYSPAPVITGPDTVCHNKIYTYSTPAVGGDTYNWSVSNGSIVTGQGTNSITILWGAAGTGTVAVTQTSSLGCDSTVSDSIVILYSPAPVITGNDSACHNKIYTYSTPVIAGNTYSWTVSNGTIVAGQGTSSADILWGTAGTGSVTVIQTSPLGCDSVITLPIQILYSPAPAITGSDSACHNKIYSYSTTSISGDTYSWTATNGTIISGQGTNTVAVLWGSAGTGSIAVTQTSPLGCDSVLSLPVQILYSPAPIISGNDSACHNKIYSYSTPIVAGDTYNWSVTNGTIVSGQGTNIVDILWGTAGTGSITVTQTSPLGCDSVVSLPVRILYTPAPAISGNDSACHNKIYSYSAPAIGGDTYNWTATNGTIVSGQGTNSVAVLWGSAGAASISVTQTSPLGCDSTLTLPVQILYSPAPVIAGPDTTCHNKIYTYSTPNIGGDSYNWSVTNGTIVTGQGTNTINVLWGAAGNGTVSVTQTSALGCDSSITDTIIILYSPAPVISGNDSACHNKVYTYSTPTIAGDTYTWNVTNGTIVAGQGTNTVNVLWGNAGTGSVSVTQTSPLGCDSLITLPVRILYSPAPVVLGPDSACHNKIYVFSVTNVAGDSYSWNITNGSIISGQGTNSITAAFDSAGLGTIAVTQTSPLGCDSTVLDTVRVLYSPAPVITGADSACYNKIYSYSIPAVAGDVYSWNVTNGTIISGQGTTSISVLWGSAILGHVAVTQTSPLGCDSTISKTIRILYSPVPVITGTDSACRDKIYTFSVNNVSGDTYNWNITNGTLISGQGTYSITAAFSTVGTGIVSLKQTSPKGCDSTVSAQVQVIYSPTPAITGPDTVCHNKIHPYSVTNVAGDTYSWTVTNGTIVSGQNTPNITVRWGTAGTGMLALTQTSPLGCDSTVRDTVTILYSPAPVITGQDSVCHSKIHTYSVPNIAGDTYNWNITNGTIISGQGTRLINVQWGAPGTGSVAVTQTSPLGCDSTNSLPVRILYTPLPVITGPDTVCHNKIHAYSVPFAPGDTYTWTVTNGVIVTGQGTRNISIRWGTAGFGTVAITQASTLGCDTTVKDTVRILYSPTPVIQGSDTVCQLTLHTYTVDSVGFDTYQWQVIGGTITAGQGTTKIMVNWLNTGLQQVNIRQTSPLGCDSLVSLPVLVRYRPAPQITGTTIVCSNKINSYSVTNIGTDTYSWTVTNGTIVSGQGTNAVSVLWGGAGNGYIFVKQTSPLGCDSTISDTITIQPSPGPVIAGNDTVCHNKVETYSVTNVPLHTYNWAITNGTLVSGQGTPAIAVLWGPAGTGRVTLTQTSDLGCDSTVRMNIVIQPSPTPVIIGPDTVCHSKLYVHSVVQVPGHTYQWTVTNGTIISGGTSNQVNIQWGAPGTGYVQVKQTSALGCDSIMRDSVVIQPSPNPQITGPDTVCHNKAASYNVSPAPAGETYQWTVTNGTIAGGQGTANVSILWGTAGTGTISIRHTNTYGCDSIRTLKVVIQPSPAPVIQGRGNICSYKVEVYSITPQAGNTYSWTVTGGGIISKIDSSAVFIRWAGPGAGLVRVTQTNVYGCDSTVTLPVTIRQSPIPVVNGPDAVCNQNQYTYAVPSQAGYTYQWTVTGGIIQGANNTFQVNVLWTTVGLNNVRLKVTSNFGCDSTVDYKVRVFELPIPDIKGKGKACANTRDNLFKDYKYNTDTSGRYKYQWSLSGGGNITTTTTKDSILVDWLTPGNYSVSLTITDTISGCVASSIFAVEIDSMDIPQIITNGLQGCSPLEITFKEKQNRNDYTYLWIIDGLGTTNKKEPSIVYKKPGTYNARVIVSNSVGCIDTANLQIVVNPNPVADFSISKGGVFEIEDTAFFTNLSTGATGYTWLFHDTTTDNNIHSSKQYTWPGTFPVKLIAQNQFGCPDTVTKNVVIKVEPKIFIPNSFTPNGDDLNDYFTISTYFIREMKLIIFDRWGEILYTTEDINFKWDGMYKDIPVQQDVYAYYVIARGFNHELISRTGNITVVR